MKDQATAPTSGWLDRLTPWKVILSVILCFGLYATVVRFAQGLGSSTNLSDAFPWGLWIGFDILVGVGLAAGGFVIAATVHVFGLRAYESIARPTILTAFMGYLLVIGALLFDLGRPYRVWHPLVMWNPHSVMFEVGWCVTLYTTVLALEFSPLLFERFGLEKPLKIIRRVYVPLVIVGVLLSTLHQSSLGTLYVIAPDKLHGLWYSPLLPVFFFISAIAGGLAMTIFESFMTRRAFGKSLEASLLRGMARVIVVVLAVYAVMRFQDLIARGNAHLMLQTTPESVLFWGEMGLGILLPLVLFALPRIRHSQTGLLFAAILTIMGFIVNRLNVAITGMAASSGVSYVPSWMELAITVSVVGVGFALFGLAVKHLPVFPREELPALTAPPSATRPWRARPALNRAALLLLWGLLLVGFVAVARGQRGQGTSPALATPPSAPEDMTDIEMGLPGAYTFPAGAESPGPVTFHHESHVDAGRPDCASCHMTRFSITSPGELLLGAMSYERVHEGDLCASCHDGVQGFGIEDDCEFCHSP
jgi:c(7)-type cytochrome triheme protein